MDRRVPGDEDRLAPDRGVVAPSHAERRSLLLATLTLLPFIALAVWARLYSPAPWEPEIVGAIALREGQFGLTRSHFRAGMSSVPTRSAARCWASVLVRA